MKKILFLHGFYASGQCVPAMALCEAFEGRSEVITPDLPMHPKEAVQFIRELTDLIIKQICDKLAFPNPSFFGKYVKDHFGMTPLEFRNN